MVSLSDYETAARRKISHTAWEYLESGAADEFTLRRNRDAFDKILLRPRVLRDVSNLDTSLELFGERLEHPVLLAPTAYHKLFHKEGELATAEGAAAAKAIYVVSSFATTSLERVAACTKAPLWYQLYTAPDRNITRDLVSRAEAAGYGALCLTVDTPVLGARNREMRSGFHLPRGMSRENLERYSMKLSQSVHFDRSGAAATRLDASLNWKDLDWLRSLTKHPLVLKGILTPEDARLAIEHGADGVIVSNHGGRNLDTVPSSLEALGPVAEAVGGRIPVLLDGGIRRGTDVLKALAHGACAVLIGRPFLWGLAVGGSAGVARVIQILVEELRSTMALCGLSSLGVIGKSALW